MPRLIRAAEIGFQIDAVPAWSMMDSKSRVTCCDCGQKCTKYRIMSKGSGTFRCNKCCYAHTRLFRSEGKGSNVTLAKMPDSERRDFFKNSHATDMNGQKQLLVAVHESYGTRERHYEYGWGFQTFECLDDAGLRRNSHCHHVGPRRCHARQNVWPSG